MHAEIAEPSAWIRRFASLAPAGGRVLDVAAGGGRHGRHFLALGHGVTFLDIDVRRLGDLDDVAGAEIVEVDLEGGNSWPFGAARFDVIVVANYLHRPHFERYLERLAPGGLLLHESFALGNAEYGRSRNPDFLLTPGELARAYGARLHIVAYEHGLDAGPPAACSSTDRLRGPAPAGTYSAACGWLRRSGGANSRSCPREGTRPRASAIRSVSISAWKTPTSSPASSSTSPQGATTSE